SLHTSRKPLGEVAPLPLADFVLRLGPKHKDWMLGGAADRQSGPTVDNDEVALVWILHDLGHRVIRTIMADDLIANLDVLNGRRHICHHQGSSREAMAHHLALATEVLG